MFGRTDKRKKGEDLINRPFPLRLTNNEMEFVNVQKAKECSTCNSIIRKALNQYRNSIDSEPK